MSAVFIADAVLFDMDGTLIDSIAAIAIDIGQDPDYVIAATHGKRAIDNLKQFKPHIRDEDMPAEVQAFEETILAYADEYNLKKSISAPSLSMTSYSSSGSTSQNLSPVSSTTSSRRGSSISSGSSDFGFSRSNMELKSALDDMDEEPYEKLKHDTVAAVELKQDLIDRSVHILPGVRNMLNSLPEGRYCVATSGAKTYAYGAMTRVGITPPAVTITADDPRLKAGKPAPDPFLLAAKCLGFDAKNCVVFEDSPSGIRAGVASGATVVALCTSHDRAKIENCGAHHLIQDMDRIRCEVMEDGRLEFTISEP